jgi:transaldolase
MTDPLADLSAHGVSVWLNDPSRELLASGQMRHHIRARSVAGDHQRERQTPRLCKKGR